MAPAGNICDPLGNRSNISFPRTVKATVMIFDGTTYHLPKFSFKINVQFDQLRRGVWGQWIMSNSHINM